MNSKNYVNFKKVRSFGDMLSDTFKFLSTEWQPFFSTIVKVAIIPVLIAICAAIYFTFSSSSIYTGLQSINEYESDINFNFSKLMLPLFVFVACYLVAYALVTVTSLSYIKSYINNKGDVNYLEIQQDVKDKFWPYVGLFLLVSIIVFIGALFCFLPGIYFGVVLSLSICLLIFQNNGVFDAISNSFSFIKDHWWETFGILLVVQILIIFASFIINIPTSIYQGLDVAAMLKSQDLSDLSDTFKDPIYLALVAFSYLVKFVFYIISTIVTVFIYFDIKEQKNPTSDDIIDEIGIE